MLDEGLGKLKDFISRNIESLAQLESLLLLRRDAGQSWTPQTLARELYVTSEVAGDLLADLTRRGFAEISGSGYSYHSRNKDGNTIDELAQVYQEKRVAVITEIYSKPLNKVQTFADAFRLRKEK